MISASRKRSRAPFASLLLATSLGVAGLAALEPPSATAADASSPLSNGSFANGTTGWSAGNDNTRLSVVTTARSGKAAALTARSAGPVSLTQSPGQQLTEGARYGASVWVRGAAPGARAALVIKEKKPGTVSLRTVERTRLNGTGWQRLRLETVAKRANSTFKVRVRGENLKQGRRLLVDDVKVVRTTTAVTAPAPAPAPGTAPAAKGRALSNGCSLSTRGIPSCGALMGGAYGANDDPAAWERKLGGPLGVRRLFYGAGQVSSAARTAKADIAKGRLSWISFKLPQSWSAMASGKGDAWVKDVARQMKGVGGPVWVSFAHEPEKDGDILVWKRMQERIGPMLRNAAPNVGYSVILMGYHEFFGSAEFRMSRIWPDTKVDIAGFDVYNHYGKNGQTKHTDMDMYFNAIQSWSRSAGVPWGLAETGISHKGAVSDPNWFKDTYASLVNKGGKAFAYFNTALNSFQDWRLSTTLKMDRFAATYRGTPTM